MKLTTQHANRVIAHLVNEYGWSIDPDDLECPKCKCNQVDGMFCNRCGKRLVIRKSETLKEVLAALRAAFGERKRP